MCADDRIGILHLISGLSLGGAEKMLLWTARHYDREALVMCVVSLMSGGPIAGAIREEGVEVVELGQRRGSLSPSGFMRLVRVARSFGPKFIQGHLFHGNILARIISPLVPGAVALSTRHNEVDSVARILAYALTSPLMEGTVVFSPAVWTIIQMHH